MTVDPNLPCGYCCAHRDGDIEKDEWEPVVLDIATGEPYTGPMSDPHPECLRSVELHMAYVEEERRRHVTHDPAE